MINIVVVDNIRKAKKFINFPLSLYKDCPYYVPEMADSEMEAVYKNILHRDQAETIAILAYENNTIVGRIQGIIQHAANEKWNQSRVRFTRFDAINSQEVANALFDYLRNWAKSKNIKEIVGPLGYSDLDREGLLIDGFEEMSTFEESYNYDYYQTLIKNYGFVKEVGWIEHQLRLDRTYKEKVDKIAEHVMKKFKLHFAMEKNINKFIKKYGEHFFTILDDTYKDIYGTVPFTDAAKKQLISDMKLICKTNQIAVILDENERPVCFGICFPSIAKSVHACKGKLFPFGFIKVLREIKHPKVVDLGLVGVIDEYKNSGVVGCIITNVMKMLDEGGIEYCETNLNLEDNTQILALWKYFDSRVHKKREAYKMDI